MTSKEIAILRTIKSYLIGFKCTSWQLCIRNDVSKLESSKVEWCGCNKKDIQTNNQTAERRLYLRTFFFAAIDTTYHSLSSVTHSPISHMFTYFRKKIILLSEDY